MTDNGLTSYTTIELSRYNEQIPLKNIHLIPELNTEVRDSKLSVQHNVRSIIDIEVDQIFKFHRTNIVFFLFTYSHSSSFIVQTIKT